MGRVYRAWDTLLERNLALKVLRPEWAGHPAVLARFLEEARATAYPVLCEPDGRIYLAGEHLSYIGGWQAGAFESAWQQVERLHARAMKG